MKKIAQTAKRIAAGLNLPLDTLTGQFRLVMYLSLIHILTSVW